MITGVSTSALSQLYGQQSRDYSKVLGQIAAGKTFTKPSDNFAAYTKMSTAQAGIATYQRSNDSLVAAKEKSAIASGLGNNMVEELNGLKKLVADNEGGDNDEAIAASIANINDMFTDGMLGVGGTKISAILGGGTKLEVDFAAEAADTTEAADPAAAITALDAADATTIDDAIVAATRMAAQADAFSSSVDRQLTINQNIMSAKEDTVANIGAIDDVQAMAKKTALEVRQQATISMATQANFSQISMARLFS